MVAKELGIVGSLRGPSAFTQKSPPKQMSMNDAIQECELLSNRKLSNTMTENSI